MITSVQTLPCLDEVTNEVSSRRRRRLDCDCVSVVIVLSLLFRVALIVCREAFVFPHQTAAAMR